MAKVNYPVVYLVVTGVSNQKPFISADVGGGHRVFGSRDAAERAVHKEGFPKCQLYRVVRYVKG